MAGYAKKSLIEKLGIKEGSKIILLNQPKDYGHALYPFPDNCSIYNELQDKADFIQIFTKNRQQLKNIFPKLQHALLPKGSLWVSWTKQSSKEKTDLNEDSIREIGLQNGLVDVKVIAIDEIWSGLKFVYRLKDRK